MAIITELRDLVPIRAVTQAEALRIAELQAGRLLKLTGITDGPVPETIITALPRVQVERMMVGFSSGAAQWSLGRWLILINGTESPTRQRFSLAHEFKHVLDHPFIGALYPSTQWQSSHERAEQICDYFAGCLLMPRVWLKRAWVGGMQDVNLLKRQFDVSQAAMRIRLLQIGLVESQPRCLSAN